MRARIETARIDDPLPIMGRTVLPAERMARKLCKALSSKFVMESSELRQAACKEVLADRRKGSPWSIGHPPSTQDFEKGLAHALSSGWVSETGGCIHLTPAGADVAHRLRISRRR